MREQARRHAALWNRVRREAIYENVDNNTRVARWNSGDERWTATMRYTRFKRIPDAMTVADRRAVRRIAASAPLGALILLLNDIEDARELEVPQRLTKALSNVQHFRGSEFAWQSVAPRSSSPAPLGCRMALPDLIEPGTPSAREELRHATAPTFERFVAAMYPKATTVWGDGSWLVDSAGFSERIGISALRVDDDLTAFAVSFPSRTAIARETLQDADPAKRCRAAAELLVVRTSLGILTGMQRMTVDAAAPASHVSGLELVRDAAEGALVRVRHSSTYGNARWIGALEWETIAAGDSLQPTTRTLLRFELRHLDAGSESSGSILLTRRLPDAVELSTVERYEWAFATRTIVLPLDPSGVVEGTALLSRLD
jgi:hypothetical protein